MRRSSQIPVFEPALGEEEVAAVAAAAASEARSLARSARRSPTFEREFAAYVGMWPRGRGELAALRPFSSLSRRPA